MAVVEQTNVPRMLKYDAQAGAAYHGASGSARFSRKRPLAVACRAMQLPAAAARAT